MAERVLLHIGTHKTGSTSIQQFLHEENERTLAAVGAHFPETGWFRPKLQHELPLVAMRPGRRSPGRVAVPEVREPAWIVEAARQVRAAAARRREPTLVYSHEDLSWLRSDDEFERLWSMLPCRDVTVVLYLRERAGFLRSYAKQFSNLRKAFPAERGSILDISATSWLVDYDALVDAYRRHFTIVEVLDYDAIVAAEGSVIPSMGRFLGIEPDALPPLDRYFLRRSSNADRDA